MRFVLGTTLRGAEAGGAAPLAANDFYDNKNYRADDEVDGQAPVFFEHGMPYGDGEERHEQEVDGIARHDGDERIEKIASDWDLAHVASN